MVPEKALIESYFQLPGPVSSIVPFGSGHIHNTYLVTCSVPNNPSFVLQHFNDLVFSHPDQVMNNISKVLSHIGKSNSSESMKIVPTRNQRLLYKTDEGTCWRLFTYVDQSVSFDRPQNPDQARAAAGAFGNFLNELSSLDSNNLFTTIPNFHNLEFRFRNLQIQLESAAESRKLECHDEIELATSRASKVAEYAKYLNHLEVPQRITHNDTKINNVLFRKGTNQAISVVDLDTVMPGLLLYDFGDMARTFCSSTLEGDKHIHPKFRSSYFDALCHGFFFAFQSKISNTELQSLKVGPWWMTFMMGIRFLTDYLAGDVYYKINFPKQNLLRARNQLLLVLEIESEQAFINQTIDKYFDKTY